MRQSLVLGRVWFRLVITVIILKISGTNGRYTAMTAAGFVFSNSNMVQTPLTSQRPTTAATSPLLRSSPSLSCGQHGQQQMSTCRTTTTRIITRDTQRLYSDKFNRDIEERSHRRAQGEGAGETVAGAILGGLVLGPFGALFGAQIGANVGSKNAIERAKQEELDRLGVTQEMLDTARDVGVALQQSMDGLQATKASLETQQSLARRLDREAEELYTKAKDAMTSGKDESIAREYLFKRTQIQDKLKQVLLQCAEEKSRLQTMEENVRVIESRALEIEAMLQRTVNAKTRLDTTSSIDLIDSDFSLSTDDPLLKKFKDLGID